MADTKSNTPKVNVKAKKAFTHAGKDVQAGNDVSVPATLVPWLVQRGVIDPPAGSAARAG